MSSIATTKPNHDISRLKVYNWKLSYIHDIYNGSRGFITIYDPISEERRIERLRSYHLQKRLDFNYRVIHKYGVLMKLLSYTDWLSKYWYRSYWWLKSDDYMANDLYPRDLFEEYSEKLRLIEKEKNRAVKLANIGMLSATSPKKIISRYSSLSRSKRRIYEIVYHTDFKYFITLTFSTKFDNGRDSMFYTFDCLRKFLHKTKTGYKRHGDPYFKYLIIPEFHADKKNVHFHMLATSPIDDLIFENDYSKLDLLGWDYGFTNIKKIDDKDKSVVNIKISSYISKYIIKQLDTNWPRRYFSNVSSFEKTKKIITGDEFEKIYNNNVSYVSDIDESIYMTFYENLTKDDSN